MAVSEHIMQHVSQNTPDHDPDTVQSFRKTRFALAVILGLSVTVGGTVLLQSSSIDQGKEPLTSSYFDNHPEEFVGIESFEQFIEIVLVAENILRREIPPDELTFDISMERLDQARHVAWQALLAAYGEDVSSTTLDRALIAAQEKIGLPKDYLHLMK